MPSDEPSEVLLVWPHVAKLKRCWKTSFHKQNKFYQQKYGFVTVTGTTSETGSGQGWSELFSPTVWKGGWIERWQYLLLIASY